MGYDSAGKLRKPQEGLELREDLPAHGAKVIEHSTPRLLYHSDVRLQEILGLVRSDGTLDVDAMDDLADLVEYLYDNRTAVLPANPFTHASIMADLQDSSDATSQASKEWTVTASKRWIIIALHCKNDTRAAKFRVSITLSGSSERDMFSLPYPSTSATTVAAGKDVDMMQELKGLPLVLDAGDKIKITDETFVASDTKVVTLFYVEVDQ